MRRRGARGGGRWLARGLVVALVLIVACFSPTAAQEPPAGQESTAPGADPAAEELARRYAPVVYLAVQSGPCDKKGDVYFPAPVEMILGNEQIGLMDGDPEEEVARGAVASDIFRRDREAYLDFPGDPRNPGCTYDRAFRALLPQPEVTYAHVVGEEREEGGPGLALQYWFFYYFNDGDNTHEGDWEMIQLSWDVATTAEALTQEPARISFAQHGGGETGEWTDEKVQTEDGHPVVFSAVGSHASYFSDGVYLMYGEEGAGLGCDDASRRVRRAPLTAILVPTDVADQDDPTAWVTFEGRWGQRESGFWNGPTGPNTKDRWTEPLTWEDGLRDFSYSVGENNPGGLGPVNLFCSIVSFGGRAANLDATNPLLARSIAAVVLLVVGGLVVRARRILGAAGRMYARHALVFAALGLLVLPIALVVNLFQLLLTLLPPVDYAIKLAERSPASWVLYLLAASGFVQIPVLVFVGPAVVEAVRRSLDGHPPGILEACRATLDRLRLLIGATFRVWLTVVALVATVVGLPWAILRGVQWAFFGQAVVFGAADSAPGASAASARVVRGRWWDVGATLVVLALLVAVVPPVIGVVLMLESDWSLAWITTVSGLLTAAVLPYAVIGATLLYRDLAAHPADRTVVETIEHVVEEVAGIDDARRSGVEPGTGPSVGAKVI